MGSEHVIPELIEKVKNLEINKKLKIQGTGKETRSFIHIDDFCDAFYLLIKKGKHLNIYNLGTEERVSINKLINYIKKFSQKNFQVINGPLKKGGTKHRCPKILKIKKLGFKQKIKLENGIKQLI